MTYTPLQVHSGYSFFNSMIQIDPLVDRAKELGFSQLALTDDQVLHGVIPFYQACLKHHIKPIIGMTVKISIDDKFINAILLAKSTIGYKHLLKISTTIQMENHCNLEILSPYSEDVICIISTQSQWVKDQLLEKNIHEIKSMLEFFQNTFNEKNLHVGVEKYGREDDQLVQIIKQFVTTENLSAVAIQDVRYLQQKDFPTYDCLQAMKGHRTWDQQNVNKQHQHRHLRTSEEMGILFADWPEVISKSTEIANECQVDLSFDTYHLPAFPTSNGQTTAEYLQAQCEAALSVKYDKVSKEVTDRLQKELDIIDSLGFNDYFLIVADFVQFAKDEQILVGPGRGSAAGSIVSYLLGITDVDPLKYDLLFERFLNPERETMPDIDIDFADTRRDEVIQYVKNKYGEDYVAQIITFGTYGARSVLRELMKTMEINDSDQAYILNQFPTYANKPIMTYVNQSEQFKAYIKQSTTLRMLFTHAIKLEGLPRHASTHAAGVVIGKSHLTEHVPLMRGSHDIALTQYAMNDLEAIGLLKMDLLGLRNLTIIDKIIRSINFTVDKTFSLEKIPEHDEKTFALLRTGKTNGIFQLESAGMKRVLLQLQPTSLDDIIALNALYRPGPMEHIPTYIARKHGKEKTVFIHEDLREILSPTYGVLVYQEQIMQVAHVIANYTLGDADVLRRAVSKKEKKLMAEQEGQFISGALKNGYSEKIAREIFSWIVRFADYGFNKSHSVAYSMIGYQLAYLKANYSTHFFAQILSSVMNEPKKLKLYMTEATERSINLLPPSINRSFGYFTVEEGNIRIGLMIIKGIGYESINNIIEARKNGVFKDLFDFCLRTSLKRPVIETLIIAGAFDTLHKNRASLLASIDKALELKILFGDGNGQTNLFHDQLQLTADYIEMEDFPIMKKLQDEKDLLHMYVSSHPLRAYRKKLKKQQIITLQEAMQMPENQQVKIVAFLQEIKKIHTKRGDSMAFITIGDETDEVEAVMFPKLYRQMNRVIKEDEVFIIEGKMSIRHEEKQIIINQMTKYNPQQYNEEVTKSVYIRFKGQNDQLLKQIKAISTQFPGQAPIILYDENEKKMYRLSDEYNVAPIKNVVIQCKQLFGDENVVLK